MRTSSYLGGGAVMTQRASTQHRALTTDGGDASGVVVGVDGSLGVLAAVSWAAADAARRRVSLHLVAALGPGAATGTGVPAARARTARAWLHRALGAARAVAPTVPISLGIVSAAPGPTLVAHASRACLLVVGGRRASDPVPASATTVAHVVAHARCPVVVVPPRWAGAWASTPSPRPVCAGLTGTDEGPVLRLGREAADRLGVELVTVGPRGLVAGRASADLVPRLVHAARTAQLIVISAALGDVLEPPPRGGAGSGGLLERSPCAVMVSPPWIAATPPALGQAGGCRRRPAAGGSALAGTG